MALYEYASKENKSWRRYHLRSRCHDATPLVVLLAQFVQEIAEKIKGIALAASELTLWEHRLWALKVSNEGECVNVI
jgi:hypothetical protein